MKKLLILIIFFPLLLPCTAQRYNTWYFGEGAGISFNAGSGTPPSILMDGSHSFYEGNASICDRSGSILFYTDGNSIYTRTHQLMLNGNDLAGNPSAVQSSIIIPAPGNDSIYYVFTTDANENNFANGYRYSVVNMNHDGGKGEVITKNVLLSASCTERLTAARHANGVDAWVIINERNSNVFKSWKVTASGIQTTPVVSAIGPVLTHQTYGMMKVSPDGTQLCQTNYPHFNPDTNYFQLFDFDNATGILSNARIIGNLTNNEQPCYGCEFSPDSKLLYVSGPSTSMIDQFEVKLGSVAAINASRVTIPAAGGFLGIQGAPDGKIYLDRRLPFLSVISNPNIKGVGCSFEQDKINLGKNGAYGLPAIINDGAFDVCSRTNYTIKAMPGQTIELGESIPLYVTGGGAHFQWSPQLWLNDPTSANPVATPQDSITYIVTATNDVGCRAIDSVTIDVHFDDGLYVPTGFTPGNDGRNDIFRPVMALQYKLTEFSVYNRWGQKVFSTHEKGKGWDGKLKGQEQDTGIYVWVLRVTNRQNKTIEKKGTVMLIR